MNKPYSFSIDQMNGIVEDTYAKIINECENLKKITTYLTQIQLNFFLDQLITMHKNL